MKWNFVAWNAYKAYFMCTQGVKAQYTLLKLTSAVCFGNHPCPESTTKNTLKAIPSLFGVRGALRCTIGLIVGTDKDDKCHNAAHFNALFSWIRCTVNFDYD